MSESVKQIVVSVIISLLAAVAIIGCSSGASGDGEFDLDKLPGYFPPGQDGVLLPYQGGERAHKAYGIVGEDGIAVNCVSTKEIGTFENVWDYIDEDVALDVNAYCKSLGYDKYPNTSDFFVSFKWIEINSVKDARYRDGVVTVKVAPNPYNQPRCIWVRLKNMKTSVMTIWQDGNPDGEITTN